MHHLQHSVDHAGCTSQIHIALEFVPARLK